MTSAFNGAWTVLGSACVFGGAFAALVLVKPLGLGAFERKRRVQAASRIVSSAHAVLTTAMGIACCAQAWGESSEEKVWGSTPLADRASGVFVGYIAYDLAACIAFAELREAASIFHHSLFLAIAATCRWHSFLKFPFSWLIISEASTPMVNLRWYLNVSGQTESKLYMVNGIALVLSFLFFRGFVYGLGLYDLATNLRYVVLDGIAQREANYLLAIPVMIFAGWLLNLFWIQKLLKGLLKVVRTSKTKKQ